MPEVSVTASMWVPFVKPYFFIRLLHDYTLSPSSEGHPFAVGLPSQLYVQEEVSRSRSAAGKS